MKDGAEDMEKGVPIREGIFVLPAGSGEKASLLGSRCKACGRVFFPPRHVCPQCFSDEFDSVRLSRVGKLYTFSIVRYAPPGLTAPYAVGYVDLPEGVRVFSILADWDQGTLDIGMDVELIIDTFRVDEDGKEILTYKFRPVRQPAGGHQ